MPKQPKFLDLEEAVEQWGWKMFELNARSKKAKQLYDKQQKKKEPCIGVRIDWSRMESTDATEWGPLRDADFKSDATTATGDDTNQNQVRHVHVAPAHKPAETTAADVNILFNTHFTNDTQKPQSYTLRVDKSTRSTCDTTVEHGVTNGFELGVSLKLPGDVFEANAGFSREVSLTKTEGECIEEEVSWGAESNISVEAGKVAEAQLVVKEKKQSGSFTILTRISGSVKLSFTNLQDNNSLLFTQSGKIDFAVDEYIKEMSKLGRTYPFVEINDGVVQITTKGTCRFRYGIRQEVKVVTRDI